CGVWRFMVFRARWRLPGAVIKAVLVFSGGTAVWAHYGSLLGPEAGTALLILGFCFKLLETHRRRDMFIAVVLGYFVVATSFFFEQQIIHTLYLMLVCFLVTAALLGLHQSPLQTAPQRTARYALRLLLHALPLMVVLFLLVPRIGPIWALDLSTQGARTGLSEQMNPGDIARLSRSAELAFRVEFDGPVPPPQQLYWRALVLDRFDGRGWSRQPPPTEAAIAWHGQEQPWFASVARAGASLSYRVIMEPSDQPWLFALDLAQTTQPGTGLTRDFRLVNRFPVAQPFSYRVQTTPEYRTDVELPRWLALRNLQLPAAGNPRTRTLARQWWQDAASPAAFVERIHAFFANQPFYYTLTPPLLGENSIDQFLFDTRQGFCSHYASAMAFMLRSVGLPARIVTGYQGGEHNALGNYLLVHQFDAHAWVEVWLPGQGWVRADPTAWVAPERVAEGGEQTLSEQQGFLADSGLFSPLRYRHWAWISKMRLGWDYLNFLWHRSVLGYNADSQQRWMAEWFGRFDWRLLAGVLVVGIVMVLALLSGWVLLRNRPPAASPLLREYRQLRRLLQGKGIDLPGGEPPGAMLLRVARLHPAAQTELVQLAALLEQGLYRSAAPVDLVRQLRRLRKRLRRLI
ncbi:MAG TPA: DUF3488 and transglutaminase-like domain-containing protein, partial [Motiliproteus sp.]